MQASAQHRAAPYFPVAPVVRYVRGPAPGDVEQSISGGAAYSPDTDTIYSSGVLPKFSRGHENFHALDDQVLTDGDRHYLTRIAGLTGAWNQGTGLTAGGLRSPSEILADWYGNAVVGHDPRKAWTDAYAPVPDPKAFRRFEQALVRLGRRNHLAAYVR